MTLKDEIENDIYETFLNEEDFAELHVVEHKEILCMFDDDKLTDRQGSNELAVSDSTALLYAKSCDLPPRMPNGERIEIDGKIYTVDDWKENMGMSEIALKRGESYGG